MVMMWTCEPHPTTKRVDMYVEENCSKFLNYVSNTLMEFLERHTDEELTEGVTLRIRYQEIDPEDVLEEF